MNDGAKTIEVIVQRDGEVAVQTHGFVGPGCREASRFIEQALGRPLTEQLTSAFHQSVTVDQSTHEQS